MVTNLAVKRDANNSNLAKRRHVAGEAYKVWIEAAALSDLWEDVELEHSLIVRTSFDDG